MPADMSRVYAFERDANRMLDNVGAGMKRILDGKAAIERRTHAYQNRTRRLEGSTFALGPLPELDGVRVEFGARMPYASYVEDRGLSRVSDLAAQATTEIDYYLDAQVERLGR